MPASALGRGSGAERLEGLQELSKEESVVSLLPLTQQLSQTCEATTSLTVCRWRKPDIPPHSSPGGTHWIISLSTALERVSCPWDPARAPGAAEPQESKHCVQSSHQSRGVHGDRRSDWPLSKEPQAVWREAPEAGPERWSWLGRARGNAAKLSDVGAKPNWGLADHW